MGGPSWLAWTFASVVIVVAAYCLTRLLVSWRQHRPSDRRVDAIHVLMGVAMAGMLVPRLRVFWAGGWEIVFGIGTAWFAWLAIREFRGRATVGGRPGHHLQHVLACAAMLYMLLAAATVARAAAGGSAMSGMAAGAAHFPTLALVLAFALFGYVVWNADRLSSLAPPARARAAEPASRPRTAKTRRAHRGPKRRPGGGCRCLLAWPCAAR
jgi:cytochrome b561